MTYQGVEYPVSICISSAMDLTLIREVMQNAIAAANHLAAQQRNSLVVNLVDLAAQNDLELAGSLHHLDHALQTADHILVRLFVVPQHEAETGEAVGHRLDVLFATDILDDVGSDLFVVHTDPPQIFSEQTQKKDQNDKSKGKTLHHESLLILPA